MTLNAATTHNTTRPSLETWVRTKWPKSQGHHVWPWLMSPADVFYVIPTIHPISIIAYPAERMELIPGTPCRRWVTPRISLEGYTERLTIPVENWRLPIRLTCLFWGKVPRENMYVFPLKYAKCSSLKLELKPPAVRWRINHCTSLAGTTTCRLVENSGARVSE